MLKLNRRWHESSNSLFRKVSFNMCLLFKEILEFSCYFQIIFKEFSKEIFSIDLVKSLCHSLLKESQCWNWSEKCFRFEFEKRQMQRVNKLDRFEIDGLWELAYRESRVSVLPMPTVKLQHSTWKIISSFYCAKVKDVGDCRTVSERT